MQNKLSINAFSFSTLSKAVGFAIQNDYDFFVLHKLGLDLDYANLKTVIQISKWFDENTFNDDKYLYQDDNRFWIHFLEKVLGTYIDISSLALACSLNGLSFKITSERAYRYYPQFSMKVRLRENTFFKVMDFKESLMQSSYSDSALEVGNGIC